MQICRLFCIMQDMYVCHSRCKITTKFPKNNGFQTKWQSVALMCRPWHSKVFISNALLM